MVDLDHKEAILFRILARFFGKEHVIPQMSLIAVCGGELPDSLKGETQEELSRNVHMPVRKWAKESRCLFTIVNKNDAPRLVIEFVGSFEDTVDAKTLYQQQYKRPVLEAAGVPFITVNEAEFTDLASPDGADVLVQLLQEKIEFTDLGLNL